MSLNLVGKHKLVGGIGNWWNGDIDGKVVHPDEHAAKIAVTLAGLASLQARQLKWWFRLFMWMKRIYKSLTGKENLSKI